MKNEDKDKKQSDEEFAKSGFRSYAVYSGVVFQMLATMGLGFWGGKKLNDYYEMENNLLTVGVGFLAMALALYNTVKNLERINKKD